MESPLGEAPGLGWGVNAPHTYTHLHNQAARTQSTIWKAHTHLPASAPKILRQALVTPALCKGAVSGDQQNILSEVLWKVSVIEI